MKLEELLSLAGGDVDREVRVTLAGDLWGVACTIDRVDDDGTALVLSIDLTAATPRPQAEEPAAPAAAAYVPTDPPATEKQEQFVRVLLPPDPFPDHPDSTVRRRNRVASRAHEGRGRQVHRPNEASVTPRWTPRPLQAPLPTLTTHPPPAGTLSELQEDLVVAHALIGRDLVATAAEYRIPIVEIRELLERAGHSTEARGSGSTQKDTCVNGHDMAENRRVNNRGETYCLTCARERARAWWARKNAEGSKA